MKHRTALVMALLAFALPNLSRAASVKPGDETPDNAALVQDLVSPGNFALVKQGMRMKIVPTERLEWPPPYKAATEKHAAQVSLNARGEVDNYVAGLPFALLDPNDPQVATKVISAKEQSPSESNEPSIVQSCGGCQLGGALGARTYPPWSGFGGSNRYHPTSASAAA